MTPPAAPPDDAVFLIADSRLDALRGQTLQVGGCLLAIPTSSAPFPVPAEAARVLLKQAGWRMANPADRSRLADGVPMPAPVIATPQPTHAGISRVRAAQVASPSAAEMAAREHRVGAAEGFPVTSMAAALAGIAAAAEAGARGETAVPTVDSGGEAERAAVPGPAPVVLLPADGVSDAGVATLPATAASGGPDIVPVGDSSPTAADLGSRSDLGGSSDPLD